MSDSQTYEFEVPAYPLVEQVADQEVTIPEEIQLMLDAGWTWDADKMVHPKDKDIWRMYKRIDSPKIASDRFNAEIKQAVQAARWRQRRTKASGE
jgi:hypothetical protein